MKKTIGILIASALIFASCGPSKEQLEAQQMAKNDSIVQTAQQALLLQQQTDAQNAAQQEQLKQQAEVEQQSEAEQQADLKQHLIVLTSQLAGAKTKLESIQEFKILRTKDEKAQQVTDQTQVIGELEAQIEQVKAQIK